MVLAKSLAITLLLFASLSKLSVHVGYPGDTGALPTSLALAECSFAVWWLWSARDDVAVRIAIPTFSVFLGLSVAKIYQQKESCGCYGAVAVSPALSAAVDVTVIVALLLAGKPKVSPSSSIDGTQPHSYASNS
jgi:hypothetical protein